MKFQLLLKCDPYCPKLSSFQLQPHQELGILFEYPVLVVQRCTKFYQQEQLGC